MLKGLIDICLLRANPQDLGASRTAMQSAIFAYAVAGMVGVLDVLTWEKALAATLVDTLLLVGATHLALQWRRVPQRVTQTLTALAGCGALLSLLALGIAWATRGWLRPEWVWAGFLLWYTLVFGHVLRHALSIPMAAGVGASLVYLILSMSVTGLFLNPGAPPPVDDVGTNEQNR